MNQLEYSYDEASDIFTIEGTKYSGDLLRMLGKDLPEKQFFQLLRREGDGTIILKRYSLQEIGQVLDEWAALMEKQNKGK